MKNTHAEQTKTTHANRTKPLYLCLCRRCQSHFSDSGHVLLKRGWQKNLEACDFCHTGRGITFGVFSKRKSADIKHAYHRRFA